MARSGPSAGLLAFGAVALLGLTSACFLRRRFGAWRYQERHEDLIVARGVMVQRLSVVPYGRMQFVEVTAGPLERLFSLVHGQAPHGGRGQPRPHPGPRDRRSGAARDRLTELGESMAAGM